jgi:cytochrome c oxidase subunit 1
MATVAGAQTRTVLARPIDQSRGWLSWVATVDHKRIGILYGVTAFMFFLMGGIEATIVRLQLAVPNNTLVQPHTYDQLFTTHALTMIFLAIMPMGVAFFNFIVPLQIGARDVAFPRLNALSYWIFLGGGLFLNIGWLLQAAPDAGWFAYAPLSACTNDPTSVVQCGNRLGMDFYVLGLQILGVASVAGALNFLVTIINLRAPGMSLMRMPVFTWMTFVVAILLVTAMPVIAIALIELTFDRFFGTNFFNVPAGGDPILWQHLFWLFGHPEVYILILPAMGIVSEILPTFSRKPLFGFPVVVFSGIAIGFMSWGVWAHHMFATGLGPVATTVFAITTMLIAVPTGVKIFNWLATLHRGSLRFSTAMLYALGFIALFTIGGISGVSHASPPADWQQTDTYYIVAHIHYVLFGGAIMGLFGGLYYWWPKIFGYMLSETLGKLNFWLVFVGMNVTFGPMHLVGLNGMPRRQWTYPSGMGWDFWNLVETIGVFVIIAGVLVFIYNILTSMRSGKPAPADPWDARTLEWSISSPPPHYNFAEVPVVHGRDAFWAMKYGAGHGGGGGGPAVTYSPPDDGHLHIHMPWPSLTPLVSAVGLVLAIGGLIFYGSALFPWVSLIGFIVLLYGVYAWCFEPVAEDVPVPAGSGPA